MTVFALTAFAALLLFLYPYIFYPLTLYLFAERPVRRMNSTQPLSATLVFAAYNEERALPAKIANLREIKQRHPQIEIIAYCDLSTDRTRELIEEASDIISLIAAEKRTGKAVGMARMAAVARGDICIFTDANVILEPDAIPALATYFADPEVGGVAGTLHYTNEDASATARVGGLYWRLEEWLKRLESRCGSLMGADGSIFATRRNLYPEVPPHLLDDMTVSMAVPLNGKRLVQAADVIAYERNATSSSDEFRRKRRIACRAFNTHRYLWPMISARFGVADVYKYVAHKLLRWFGLLWLTIFVTFGGLALALAGQWALIGLFALLGGIAIALGEVKLQPFVTLTEVLKSIVATFYGIVDSLRGLTYQTWAPAKSRD
ncbi:MULTISPECIES: glycosyltransferase [unclassified Sphingomonas]|uniref:glycosyltransferase n=1 Tax=unclassified Sphingomonas TaxID=196159 RepID=UPI000831B781|nr:MULTISPECIES: glycosyltransferase [unclassified Sphingomonas]